jgi:non-specific protein-tyrosine kinase
MNLVTLTQPASASAEAYRSLRTNLLFARTDVPLKSVLITSPDSAKDAATVTANLAVSMAQSERRVIVVDANLREPMLHTLFEVPNNAGLADVLGHTTSDAPARISDTPVPGLRVLTCGLVAGNAADLLSSNRMDAAISMLGQQCDVVLLCAAPLMTYSDAAVVASKVNGTLLVVRAGKTRRDAAQKAKDMLAMAHVHVLGAVLLGAEK